MKIVELGEDGGSDDDCGGREIVPIKAKKALVGAGARILFYPTLLYNVFRSKIQAEFRWWGEVDQDVPLNLTRCMSEKLHYGFVCGPQPFNLYSWVRTFTLCCNLGLCVQITPLQRVENPCNCNASSAVRTLLHRERKLITWQLMLITWKALLMLTKVLMGVSRLYWGGKVSGPVCKVDRLRTKLKLHNKFLLLGAVPFRTDVPRLQQLGVQGVVTLNEPYETLVPSSLYQSHGIDHLVIPTRDYLFAPSLVDICRAVDFIHKNATCGRTTYVHCKAGRGRSTTIVLCYLVKYKHMTPAAALEYVRSIRPRVLLARTQWKAVQDFSKQKIASFGGSSPTCSPAGDAVLITEADLEGYYGTADAIGSSKDLTISSHGNRIARARPMIARLACLFASLKVSGGSSLLVSHRLPEIRAC